MRRNRFQCHRNSMKNYFDHREIGFINHIKKQFNSICFELWCFLLDSDFCETINQKFFFPFFYEWNIFFMMIHILMTLNLTCPDHESMRWSIYKYDPEWWSFISHLMDLVDSERIIILVIIPFSSMLILLTCSLSFSSWLFSFFFIARYVFI